MTLKVAIECVERKQMCNKEDIRDCYAKECDKCEYSVSHDAFIMALDVILAELDYDAYVMVLDFILAKATLEGVNKE